MISLCFHEQILFNQVRFPIIIHATEQESVDVYFLKIDKICNFPTGYPSKQPRYKAWILWDIVRKYPLFRVLYPFLQVFTSPQIVKKMSGSIKIV